MGVSQKNGNQSTSRPSNITLEYISKAYHKDIFSTVFIVRLFITARTWKQPRRPLNKEWIKKMWYIEILLNCKSNAILKYADKGKELKKNPERGNPDPEKLTQYELTQVGNYM